jgi:RimJ/RimL family protein N-acetyltransferase
MQDEEGAVMSEAVVEGRKVTLRPMQKEDAQSLLEFFKQVPAEDRLYLKDDVTDPKVIETWADTLDYGRVLPMLAEVNGRIVGDATLHRDKTGWLRHMGTIRLVIDPEFRGKGLAALMIGELLKVAEDAGLDKVMAEVVAEQTAAIRTFSKHGFQRLAVLPGHVRDLRGTAHDLVLLVYDVAAAVEEM